MDFFFHPKKQKYIFVVLFYWRLSEIQHGSYFKDNSKKVVFGFFLASEICLLSSFFDSSL